MARCRKKKLSQFALGGKRPSGVLDERKFFLIVTEGKTETQYFRHFSSTTGPRIESVNKEDSKVNLVKKAAALRDWYIKEGRYTEGDETWAVFDRDVDNKKPNDKDTFNQALELARKKNIKVAYSNDSFELWFLLHLQCVSTAMHRRDIEKRLKRHLGSYKHGDDVFDKINDNYSRAVKRAKQMLGAMESSGTQPVDANPSTTVYLLTEELRKDMS